MTIGRAGGIYCRPSSSGDDHSVVEVPDGLDGGDVPEQRRYVYVVINEYLYRARIVLTDGDWFWP